jgi:predicted RNase H-like HicB family nuclease
MKTRIAKIKPEEYLKRPYTRVLVPEEDGGFSAEILEFKGCFSQGDTAEEAYRNLEEAALSWIEASLELGHVIPEPMSGHEYSGKVALRLPRSLHREAIRLAEKEGVSLNQFLTSAVSEKVGAVKAQSRIEQSIADRVEKIEKQLMNAASGNIRMPGSSAYKFVVVSGDYLQIQHSSVDVRPETEANDPTRVIPGFDQRRQRHC